MSSTPSALQVLHIRGRSNQRKRKVAKQKLSIDFDIFFYVEFKAQKFIKERLLKFNVTMTHFLEWDTRTESERSDWKKDREREREGKKQCQMRQRRKKKGRKAREELFSLISECKCFQRDQDKTSFCFLHFDFVQLSCISWKKISLYDWIFIFFYGEKKAAAVRVEKEQIASWLWVFDLMIVVLGKFWNFSHRNDSLAGEWIFFRKTLSILFVLSYQENSKPLNCFTNFHDGGSCLRVCDTESMIVDNKLLRSKLASWSFSGIRENYRILKGFCLEEVLKAFSTFKSF